MPELPEVESVRRQLAPRLTGRRIVEVSASAQRRFADVEHATGRRIESLRRRGKYLLADLDDGAELVMHLGMTGSFRFRGEHGDAGRRTCVRPSPRRRDAWTSATCGASARWRWCRRATTAPRHPRTRSDPSRCPTTSPPRASRGASRATTMPVKPFLLRQRPVAGVGNIYADEALWRRARQPHARRVGQARAHALGPRSARSSPRRSSARGRPSATTRWSTASRAATPTSWWPTARPADRAHAAAHRCRRSCSAVAARRTAASASAGELGVGQTDPWRQTPPRERTSSIAP